MTFLAQTLLWVFIALWAVGVAAHLYATRYFLPLWWRALLRKPAPEGYLRKTMIGYGVFVGAVLLGFLAGGLAHLAGGWE